MTTQSEELQEVTCIVYYATEPTFREKDAPKTIAEFNEKYTQMMELLAKTTEEVFVRLQGDFWDTKKLGPKRVRSMSVGDIIYIPSHKIYWFCADCGFDQLELT